MLIIFFSFQESILYNIKNFIRKEYNLLSTTKKNPKHQEYKRENNLHASQSLSNVD